MSRVIKVDIYKIKYFIILLAIIKPSYLPTSWMLLAYRGIEAIGLVLLMLDYVKYKNKRNQMLLVTCSIFYIILLFSTVINGGAVIDLLQNCVATVYVILWFDSVMNRKPEKGLEILMLVFEVIMYVNYATILLFPQGLYRALDSVTDARYGWVLGHQALLIMYAAPAICIAQMFRQLTVGKLRVFRSMMLSLVSILSIFTVGGATGIFSIILISALTVAFCVIDIKKFSFWPIYIGVAVVMVMIVILSATDFIEPIVTGLLKRSMQFTGRRAIWDKALMLISKRPILGYGVQTEVITRGHIIAVHAHNMYLHCIYQGGVFCLVAFGIMCSVAFDRVKKIIRTFHGRILVATLISLLVQMIFEVYFFHNIGCILFCLAYYSPMYCEGILSNENNLE